MYIYIIIYNYIYVYIPEAEHLTPTYAGLKQNNVNACETSGISSGFCHLASAEINCAGHQVQVAVGTVVMVMW
jgi:hypothetical protein